VSQLTWIQRLRAQAPIIGPVDVVLYLSAAVLVVLRIAVSDELDDAYITYQYARNIAEGLGFVYSERFATWGTTTPLFTLLLAAANAIGANIVYASRVLDFVAMALQAGALAAIMSKLGMSRWVGWATLLLAGFWGLATSFPGMEYGLYTGLSVAALAAVVWDRWVLAGILAALTAVTRPDGALVAMLVGLAYLIHVPWREYRAKFFVAIGAIPFAWYTFAYFMFGRVTPQTLEQRQQEALVWGSFWNGWRYNLFNSKEHQYFLIPAILGLMLAVERERRIVWLGVYFVCYIAMYTAFGLPGILTYMCPLHLVAIIFNIVWLGIYWKHFPTKSTIIRVGLTIVTLICTWSTLNLCRMQWDYLLRRKMGHNKLRVYKHVGEWLNLSFAPRLVFATNEIGILGYTSRQDVIELGGLVNGEYPVRRRDGELSDYLREVGPALIILPKEFVGDMEQNATPSFLEDYRILADLPTFETAGIVVYWKLDEFSEAKLDAMRNSLAAALLPMESLRGVVPVIKKPRE